MLHLLNNTKRNELSTQELADAGVDCRSDTLLEILGHARRGKVVSLWVVPTTAIIASAPSDAGPLFDPGNDKAYRHPQFYKVPRGVRGL